MTEGPLLQEAQLVCVYYNCVPSHSQMQSWDFSFEELAMDTN